MRAASRVAAAASVIAGAIGIGLFSAHADPVAEGRPTHLSLGTVSAAAGETRLPRDKVKVAWRTHVATTLRDEALVRAGEPTVVADPRAGTFTLLGPSGEVQHTLAVSSQGFAGKPLRLGDGTVVAVTTTGDVVGYRREQLRFRVPVGAGAGAGHATPALLALDDGGFVLGLDSELLAFDGRGALRARTGLSDRITGSLAAFGSPVAAIAAVTSSGMVVTWSPGGEVRAAGELGDARPSIVGGERAMTAIVDAQRIVDLDVVTHELRTREEARGAALFLDGPLALRSPARSFAVLELDGTHLSVLVYPRTPPSPGGSAPEPRRTRLATLPGLASSDAGAAPAAPGTAAGRSGAPGSSRSAAIPATGAAPLLVPAAELVADASGAFAFALAGGGLPPGGVIGIADPATGTVTTLDRTLCLPDAGAAAPTAGQPARPGEAPRTDIAGLAIGVDELVVTCGDGDVVALVPL
jgi:hypothetical protein